MTLSYSRLELVMVSYDVLELVDSGPDHLLRIREVLVLCLVRNHLGVQQIRYIYKHDYVIVTLFGQIFDIAM